MAAYKQEVWNGKGDELFTGEVEQKKKHHITFSLYSHPSLEPMEEKVFFL